MICIKDRLPDRHSCLNLYLWVIKFSQSVSQSVSLSLSLPLSLTHTRIQTDHTHTHIHACTPPQTLTHTHTLAHTCAHAHTHLVSSAHILVTSKMSSAKQTRPVDINPHHQYHAHPMQSGHQALKNRPQRNLFLPIQGAMPHSIQFLSLIHI